MIRSGFHKYNTVEEAATEMRKLISDQIRLLLSRMKQLELGSVGYPGLGDKGDFSSWPAFITEANGDYSPLGKSDFDEKLYKVMFSTPDKSNRTILVSPCRTLSMEEAANVIFNNAGSYLEVMGDLNGKYMKKNELYWHLKANEDPNAEIHIMTSSNRGKSWISWDFPMLPVLKTAPVDLNTECPDGP